MVLGYISISTMAGVIILEFIEMVTEMFADLYEFTNKICRKRKIRELNKPQESK